MREEHPPIWVGEEYEAGGILGARVLVIGESTYPAPGDDTWLYNRRIPEEHIAGVCRDSFRTRLVRAFLKTDRETLADIARVWDSVAFFNYITEPLVGAGMAPSGAAWESQHQPLDERLAELRPQAVLVLSFRLRDRLTQFPPVRTATGPVVQGAGRPQTYWWEAVDSVSALAYGMKHPSYISWRSEHPRLMEVISLAKAGRQGAAPYGRGEL